jgi:TRAP-type C4-dicarboxylate transport system substrate-binding protein
MTETLGKLNLQLLGNVAEGFIGVVSTKKPDNHATIGPKGIHIRVWGSKVAKDTTEAIGFKTITMNWGEVFAAVQAGTVDGAICCTPQATYTVFAQSDIGKYYVPYNAFVEASTYYASKKTWDKLNDEQKAAVQAAIDRAAASFTDWARTNDAGYIQKLKDAGYEVLDLSDAERAALVKHIKDNVWPQIEKVVGKDIVDRLKADM